MSDTHTTENTLPVDYTGNGERLLPLAIKTSLLTLVTLGIYRFWARTRIRKFFWSGVTIGGQPFEYDGKGLEKFLGFLIAVAVLAIYLGLLQVLLSFAGMSLFSAIAADQAGQLQAVFATYISLLALVPLIFYAAYRAQRYKLSRTRWRGIRFAMDKAAWGYTVRGIMYWVITILTLGILTPLMTFRLEKFKADRTYYGQTQMSQGGSWIGLYPAMKHVGIAIVLFLVAALSFWWMGLADLVADGDASGANLGFGFLGSLLIFVSYIWFMVGMAYYRVHSFRYLTAHKRLGEHVTAISEPLTSHVIGYYLLGAVVGALVAVVTALVLAVVFGGVGYAIFGAAGGVLGAAMGYIGAFISYGVVILVLSIQPTIEHFAKTTTLYNTDELDAVAQREGDDFLEAEGFADALELGAGF